MLTNKMFISNNSFKKEILHGKIKTGENTDLFIRNTSGHIKVKISGWGVVNRHT